MLINCLLCKYVGEVIGSSDSEGKPLATFVECPRCGYNTTIKTDLERFKTYDRNAYIFDPLELPLDMPAKEVIKKRIEWARLGMNDNSPNKVAHKFEISLLENAPLEISELDKQIRRLIDVMLSTGDPVDKERMNFERKILWWIKAVIQRQQPK